MLAGAIRLQLSSETYQRPCSMGTLVAAVVSGARSPSPPYDCVARRASASNVVPSRSLLHLSSASSSSSASGGCGLYISLVITKSKFFPVEHRRVKHRKRIIMVKGSNSTFELEEGRIIHEVHSEEPRVKQEEFVVRGRVGWSHDGKAKILWGTQQPQDRVAQPAEKDGSDAFVSLDRSPQIISGESEDFRARRQQRAFPLSSKVSRRGLNRHNDLFEKASKNNSIKDSRIEGTSTTSAHNGLSLFGSSAAPRGALSSIENNYQSSSPSTSRLEEILENFKISKKRESYRSQRKQSAERGDLSSERNISESQDIHTFAQSRIITQTSDDINVGYQTFLEHEGTSVDMFLGVEDDYHERVPNSRRKSRIGRKDKYGDIDGYNTHGNSVMPLKGEMGSSTISQVQSLGRRVEPGSFERQVTLMGRVKHNLEDDDSESDAKVQHENFTYSRPYNTASKSKTRNERRRGASLNNNSINSRSDSKAESWGRVANHDTVNSTGVHSGSKLSKQGSGVDHFHIRQTDGVLKSGNRDTRIDSQDKSKQYTKGQYMRGPNNDYRSTVHKYSVDMEDNLEISFSSSSEDEGSHHVQSKRDKQQILSSSVKPKNNMLGSLVEDGKASWHNQFLPGLPFELQFSYSEAPKAPIIRYREPPYSPLGPDTLGRPWTGGRPLTKSKKNLPVFDSFKPPPKGKKGVKHVQDPGPYRDGQGPKPAKSRDEILGEPLTSKEVAELVDKCQEEKRQLNLGRDGLTHNMLDLIHNHWKRRRVVRIRCLGVPTVDMDNVCFHLEDKTGGKIIFRRGGFIYLFRGRNYNYKDRPEIPLMLWKPRTPVYPRLIERAPGGLTKEQADQLRLLGKKIEPLCTLAKNGIYLNLVNDVRAAFKLDKLVRINCRGLNPSDYKKIGAKLRDLVPCVLLSFEDEQILMWKGNDSAGSTVIHSSDGMDVAEEPGNSLSSDIGRTSLGVSDLGADDHTDDHVVDSNTHFMNEGLSSSSVMPVSSSSSHDKGENNSISRNNNSTLSYPSDNSQSHHGSEDTHDAIHAEAANIGSFMAGSEINSSLEMAQVFQNKLGPPVGAQSTSVDSVSDTLADVLSSCPKEQSEDLDQNIPDISEPKVLSISGDVWDGHVHYKEGTMALESVIEIPEALNEGRAIEHSSYVHELWNQAIESKTAIHVEDKMDDDFYFAKAGELANAVPTTEEYSRQLVHKLSLKIEKTKNSEDEMLMHYRMLQKLKLEKKLSKRRFRTRKIAPEEGPQDLPQSSGDGMPIDELVQILSIR